MTAGLSGGLRDRLITLAGTPDDEDTVATDLIIIAQLTADRIAAVSYASVTRCSPDGYATVAASSDLAVAVDEAQYADRAGPCLEALATGRPSPVPDITATMVWPGFRETAAGLGLHASLSVPLFAARGTPVAALNLYAHHPERMTPFTAAVLSAYQSDGGDQEQQVDLDLGARELVAGLIGAFAVRSVIQQALGVIMSVSGYTPHQAYAALCSRAVEAEVTVTAIAIRLTSGQRW
jgi:hypothetical protein